MKYDYMNTAVQLRHHANKLIVLRINCDANITIFVVESVCKTLYYEGISLTKFNNLNVKRVKSSLKYTKSKLVKQRPH